MKISELADRAIEKLNQGWTTGASARGADGFAVIASDSAAVSWCALGAITAVTGNYDCYDGLELRRWANRKALEAMGYKTRAELVEATHTQLDDVAYFNDRVAKDKQDVIALFEKIRAEALEMGK